MVQNKRNKICVSCFQAKVQNKINNKETVSPLYFPFYVLFYHYTAKSRYICGYNIDISVSGPLSRPGGIAPTLVLPAESPTGQPLGHTAPEKVAATTFSGHLGRR
jgi:hypothetical protein